MEPITGYSTDLAANKKFIGVNEYLGTIWCYSHASLVAVALDADDDDGRAD